MMCDDELIGEASAPDGGPAARELLRDCGATVDFITVVQVKGTFGFTDVLLVSGGPNVEMEWSGAKRLVLGIPPEVEQRKIFPKASRVAGVDIAFVRKRVKERDEQ